MTSPHLSKGSTNPPKTGKLRHYSMVFCPYAQRVRLVLSAKDIDHETVNINLKDKPEWLFELNPEGKVPILDTGDKIITESLVISDYLDDQYPEHPLYPREQALKQKDKELIASFDNITGHFVKAVFNTDNKPLSELVEGVKPEIERLEKELEQRGTFFGGAKPGMADYMLWPFVERVLMFPLLYKDEKSLFSTDAYPRLKNWYQNMETQKAVEETRFKPEVHFKLIQLYRTGGTVDYDELYLTSKV